MRRVLLLALLIPAFAGCVEDASFTTVEAPTLQAGNSFAYAISGQAAADAVVRVNGETVDEAHEEEPIPQTPFMAYEILTAQGNRDTEPLYLAAARLEAALDMDMAAAEALAIRHRDLALVPISLDPFTIHMSEGTYLDFPLSTGKTWTYQMENSAEEDLLVGDFEVHAKATEQTLVRTAAGDVDAIRVVADARFPDKATLVAEFEQALRNEGLKDVHVSLDVTLRIVTDYAPAVRNVAQETTIVDVDLRARFTESGDRYDLRAHSRIDTTMILTGVQLTAGTDMGLEGAIAALQAGRLPADPTGTATIIQDGISVSLDASARDVNAFDAETIDFTATAQGVPGDAFLAYEIRDARGETVSEGQGGAFSHTFDAPGIHQAIVMVTDGERVLALDQVAIAVDYIGTVTVACGPLSVAGLAECAPATVPLRPGATQALVTLDAKTAGLLGLPGTLTFQRGGEQSTWSTMGGASTVDLSAFNGSDQDGRLQWAPTVVGALESVAFSFDIDYGATTPDTPETGMPDVRALFADLLDLAGL